MPTKITCDRCKGSGLAPVSPCLETTVALFIKGARMTAAEVRVALLAPTSVEAMNGRLEILRAGGVLDREREGKSFVYFLKSNHTHDAKKPARGNAKRPAGTR